MQDQKFEVRFRAELARRVVPLLQRYDKTQLSSDYAYFAFDFLNELGFSLQTITELIGSERMKSVIGETFLEIFTEGVDENEG